MATIARSQTTERTKSIMNARVKSDNEVVKQAALDDGARVHKADSSRIERSVQPEDAR